MMSSAGSRSFDPDEMVRIPAELIRAQQMASTNGTPTAISLDRAQTFQTEFEKLVQKSDVTLHVLKGLPGHDDKENLKKELIDYANRTKNLSPKIVSPVVPDYNDDSSQADSAASEKCEPESSSTKPCLTLGFLGKAKKIKLKEKDKPRKSRTEASFDDTTATVKKRVGRPLKVGERAGDSIIVNSSIPPEKRRMGRPPVKNSIMSNEGSESRNIIEIADSSDETVEQYEEQHIIVEQVDPEDNFSSEYYPSENFPNQNYLSYANFPIQNFPGLLSQHLPVITQRLPVITQNFSVIQTTPQPQIYEQISNNFPQALPILKTADVTQSEIELQKRKPGRPMNTTKPKIFYTQPNIKIEPGTKPRSQPQLQPHLLQETESDDNESNNSHHVPAVRNLKKRGRKPGKYGKYKKSSSRGVGIDDALPPLESVLNGSVVEPYEITTLDEPAAEEIVVDSTPPPKKRGRGRPRGSFGKQKTNEEPYTELKAFESIPDDEGLNGNKIDNDSVVKKGRGRPVGSYNKATIEKLKAEIKSEPQFSYLNDSEAHGILSNSVIKEFEPIGKETKIDNCVQKQESEEKEQHRNVTSRSFSNDKDLDVNVDVDMNMKCNVDNDDSDSSQEQDPKSSKKRGRGRPRIHPPKVRVPGKGRGRPVGSFKKSQSLEQAKVTEGPPKKRVGRPPKDPNRIKQLLSSPNGPRKRGRKPGVKYGKYRKTQLRRPFNLEDRRAKLNIRKPNYPQFSRNDSVSSSQGDDSSSSSSSSDNSSSSSDSSSSFSEDENTPQQNQTFNGYVQQQNVIVEPINQTFNGYEITEYGSSGQYLDNDDENDDDDEDEGYNNIAVCDEAENEETVYEEYIGEDYHEEYIEEQQTHQQHQPRIVETISLSDEDDDSDNAQHHIYNSYQEPEIII